MVSLLATGLSSAGYAQVATITQLNVPAPSVAVGVPTLLTATVADSSNHAVLLGTVTFYDGSRALGSAQIVSRTGGAYPVATAGIKTASFATGANNITAVFAGTKSDLPSTSSPMTVMVAGGYKTVGTLGGTSNGADYTLTAALQAYGTGLPTGSVDFVHTTTGTTLGTAPLSGAPWAPSFVISSSLAVGKNPSGVAAGDFDGDGFLDLAVSNVGGNNLTNDISVLLGHGDGTFKPQMTYLDAGGYPYYIHTADFNNDGRLDLVVLNVLSSSIGILIGNGDGTFQAPVEYGSVNDGGELCIADLDGDGNLDIAVPGDNGAPGVTILLGKGDGTFVTHGTYAVSAGPLEVHSGDLNGDGIPDLVLGTSEGESVLLGKGDGSFLPQVTYAVGVNPLIALADVNGDGKLDVVASMPVGSTDTVTVSFGKGDGTFDPPQTYPLPGGPRDPIVVDINQDGILDIVVGVSANGADLANNVVVLLGNGNGTFQPAAKYFRNAGLSITGDFNGDGRQDLVDSSLEENVNVALNGQTTTLQFAGETLGGTTTIEAAYPGDASFAASTSNLIQLGGSIDFSGGFAGSGTGLQLNNGATVAGNALQLTNGGQNEATSAYSATPMNIERFVTDFVFTIGGAATTPGGDGFTFTIQKAGPTAVGGRGGGLGYEGIPRSVAVKFDIFNNDGEGNNSIGLYTGGARPTLPAITPLWNVFPHDIVTLSSGDPIRAHITYDGTSLAITLTDTVTLVTYLSNLTIDIPAAVGGTSAYVGFTGATGGLTSTEQIDSWSYASDTPPPTYPYPGGFLSGTNLQFNGLAGLDPNYGAVLLNDAGVNEAGSAFYLAPQNVQAFTTSFTFAFIGTYQFGGPFTGPTVGDGLTFTIQNDAPNALGGVGGSLGYEGINKSVAIKFDLYDNDGEGNNSTGLYVDGARPTLPAIDLTSSGINLHSSTNGGVDFGLGDFFDVQITYDGTSLSLTIKDEYSAAIFSHSWPIDIPATVGKATAYVGFTGSTGGLTSADRIFGWTYIPGMP